MLRLTRSPPVATSRTPTSRPAAACGASRDANWIGPDKNTVLPPDPATGATGSPTSLVDDAAHRAGLDVVVYTIRDENQFMAANFRRGGGPNAFGDVFAEVTAFLEAGVDGLFADYPDSAVFARDVWLVRG